MRTKNAICSCQYMPHGNRKCKVCGHFVAHHAPYRDGCKEGWNGVGCGECDEYQARER